MTPAIVVWVPARTVLSPGAGVDIGPPVRAGRRQGVLAPCYAYRSCGSLADASDRCLILTALQQPSEYAFQRGFVCHQLLPLVGILVVRSHFLQLSTHSIQQTADHCRS